MAVPLSATLNTVFIAAFAGLGGLALLWRPEWIMSEADARDPQILFAIRVLLPYFGGITGMYVGMLVSGSLSRTFINQAAYMRLIWSVIASLILLRGPYGVLGVILAGDCGSAIHLLAWVLPNWPSKKEEKTSSIKKTSGPRIIYYSGILQGLVGIAISVMLAVRRDEMMDWLDVPNRSSVSQTTVAFLRLASAANGVLSLFMARHGPTAFLSSICIRGSIAAVGFWLGGGDGYKLLVVYLPLVGLVLFVTEHLLKVGLFTSKPKSS